MKKLKTFAIMLAAILCLVACGKKEEKVYSNKNLEENVATEANNTDISGKPMKLSKAFNPKRDGVWFAIEDSADHAGINTDIKAVFIFDKGKSYCFMDPGKSNEYIKLGDVSKLLSETKKKDQAKAIYDLFAEKISAANGDGEVIHTVPLNEDNLVDSIAFVHDEDYRKEAFDLMRKNKTVLVGMAKKYLAEGHESATENINEELIDKYIDMLEEKFPKETDQVLFSYTRDKTGNEMSSELIGYKYMLSSFVVRSDYFFPLTYLTFVDGYDEAKIKDDHFTYYPNPEDAYNFLKESNIKRLMESLKSYNEFYMEGISEPKSFFRTCTINVFKPIKESTGGQPIVVYDNKFDGYAVNVSNETANSLITLNDDSVRLILDEKGDKALLDEFDKDFIR